MLKQGVARRQVGWWSRTPWRLSANALLMLALVACGGGGNGATGPFHTDTGVGADPVFAQQSPADFPRVGLSLTSKESGQGRTVILSAADATELYQLSCRISYDSASVSPLTVERGALIDERAVFFSTTQAAGFVPLAFTYHPGEAIPASAGELVRIEFEVLDASRDAGFAIIEDNEFLIANDHLGQPLVLEIEVGQ